ncbi:hypothetical protein P3576_23760 [Vibrio parahaemolyticus]|uniref:hypothetical protein n=1 Tax=Vibrio parahaemolyticus TaxID=670 RepID=UPI001121E9F4|nr:hypothetical protein [Vibrio parahaemolyticus]EHH2535369.1 hypothetical protein [Vibrio parahaemolyticus]ELA8089045.1 hypothetical protein [Vibrio parahaemolyticus]ELA8206138.1 hypothetical protein [Vibrio parahaemolyticus]ELB2031059.1 hypothetical protein [Vibrio parahaemolyticus]ELB2142338.1 hypothetical protein [Vibrio parahaemolyticus]
MSQDLIKQSAEAVDVALEKVKQEMTSMSEYCASQSDVIRDLIAGGETFSKANEISSDILDSHIAQTTAAYKDWLKKNKQLQEVLNKA